MDKCIYIFIFLVIGSLLTLGGSSPYTIIIKSDNNFETSGNILLDSNKILVENASEIRVLDSNYIPLENEPEIHLLDSNNISVESSTQIGSSKVQATTKYHAGVRETGDHKVGWGYGRRDFIFPISVGIKVEYPKSGAGALVTYVQCDIQQLLNLGRGYITSGGIGQHHIAFVIESYFTTYFYFDCEIYGK